MKFILDSEQLQFIQLVYIALLSKTQQSNMSQPAGDQPELFFFEQSDVKDLVWTCQKRKMRMKQNFGYTNLSSHINAHHKHRIAERVAKNLSAPIRHFQSVTYLAKWCHFMGS